MATSPNLSIPGLNGRFLKEHLPDWLKHATPADLKRWREGLLPAQFTSDGQADWFTQASEADREALNNAQKRSRTSSQALARALKNLQPLSAFAEPLLMDKLTAELDEVFDVNTTQLVEIHYEAVLLGSMLRLQPRRQTLMQAALQNFAADTAFEKGSALAPQGAFELELKSDSTAARPQFQYRYTRKLKTRPESFAKWCHELDLGGKYQAHLSEVFEAPETADEVRTLSMNAYKDNLRLLAQTAFMKGEITSSARQMFNQLLEGNQAALFHGKPVSCQTLTMYQSPLGGVLTFSANRITSNEQEPIVAYFPGAPLYPLKEYPSVKALKQDLRVNLLSPTYRQLFRSYVPQHEQAHFFKLLDEKLLDNSAELDPGANLHLRDEVIEGELFDYVHDQQLARLKASALALAVPSAQVDEEARNKRVAYWESIGFNALNAAAFIVPALGGVMAVVAGYQLLNEVVDGAHAWEAGDIDEAVGHFESAALNLTLAIAGGVAGSSGRPINASERVDGLLRVTLPGGEERLWKPDLEPYARDVVLTGRAADAEGVYHLSGKQYIRIDERVFEVAKDAEGEWSIRHPEDDQAYQPALTHNGEGTWQAIGEQPLQWSHEQLLKRIGVAAHGLTEEELEQAVKISGVDDDVLRRMHQDHMKIPPLLKEALRRYQVDRRVSRLITCLREGAPNAQGLGFEPTLAQDLTRWPQRVFEVYDETNLNREPIRYGAHRWPSGRVIRLSVQEIFANKLAEKVLADLTDSEAIDLFGTSVEADKRLDVLRARVAERASARRGEIFKVMYEDGGQSHSPEQLRLMRDFPTLTDAAALEIADAADATELKQLQANEGRVPMRLAEEARIYQRQIVLGRAIQGLHRPTLASLDSDRLALGLLGTLPGWSDTVRVEMRENGLSGRLLASVGSAGGELKSLVRQEGLFSVFDAQGLELAKGEEIGASLLKALPDSERQAMGLEVNDSHRLCRALYAQAIGDQAVAAKLLGQQSIKPWFRAPMRLADGRVGYPLGGTVGSLAVNAKLQALYPELTAGELEAMKARLLVENQTMGDALFKLDAERTALNQTLAQWVQASTSDFQRSARVRLRERLINAWHRKGRRRRAELILDEPDAGALPALSARYEHIRRLIVQPMHLQQLPVGFLRCFPKLQMLSLTGNPLGVIPADVAALTDLRQLTLTEAWLESSDDMFEVLRPLVRLQSLELQNNHLESIPASAAQALASLPVLGRLNLSGNAMALSSTALEVLNALPLRFLDLSNTELALDEVGAHAFAGFTHLQRLNLNGNPLGSVVELAGLSQLQHLGLRNCQLTQWPEGLLALMNQDAYALRTVDLSHNQLTQVPDLAGTHFGAGLARNADGLHELDMYFNPLDAQSIAHLNTVAAAFHSEVEVRMQPDFSWVEGASQSQRNLWHELFQQQRHRALNDVLSRLALSSEFERNAADLRARVWSMLQLASEHTQLREDLVDIAGTFPVTCGDAGADAFSALEIAVLVFQRSLEANTGERAGALIKLYAQLFRRHEVERMADALSLARTLRRQALVAQGALPALDPLDDISDSVLVRQGVDDIEIRLLLRQGLAEALDYPEPSNGMLFEATANVSSQTITRVAGAVRARDTLANRQAWMVDESSWQRYLKQRYGDQFDQVSTVWAEGLEYLSYCDESSEEVPDLLDSEVLAVLRTVLEGEPLDEAGALRRLRIRDGYLAAVDTLASARNRAEVALMKRLTQALSAS
ncbi:NEL-type E3 ubiquitin ligase domain-containing protein [Pseudomonas auratipiscis]|uniref:RING-type E3 ubiquitin transferase n=1 Tax=Pseudomonas auratipiscis TaxID=3115853 RepID=A0AB35WPQ4_9PSED|nr:MULTISPECIES: NEL-type E3 ubiquitin ligase domain-containing protein [unclassified Pseudomonas]MEE1865908.1 NEL-type E3 ubiquitin ligase domain-containing protein [Pseudomonas sp. 120P]MEE1956923.1 NEL-type E3 ubiquitin ligase domain-containing protein [Pseudomonas sp. 119P]